MRLLIVIAIVLAFCGQALAQRATGSFVIAPRPQPSMHPHHFSAPVFLGGGWYPGYGTDVVQTTPQVIVLQTPAPAAPVVQEEPKPIKPLMIEFQGGQYVRSDKVEGPVQQVLVSQGTRAKVATRIKQLTPPEIVPATLIFRDGHREQVREYTVADGAIYAHGDYWVDGYWNKKILLSALDVPATVTANRASGSNFAFPSAPNVVIVGP